MNDRDLASMLLVVADQIERSSWTESAGLLRQAARRIATGEPVEGCERCGKPLTQPLTGRPRKFCSERCRKRRRKLKVVA